MSKQTREVERRVFALLEPVMAVDGYELVEVAYVFEEGRAVLRVYIDKADGGITLDDTTEVTHLIDPVLDVEDPIDHAYTLEVSSPGLDRPLRKPEHFARYAGAQVRIRTEKKLEDAGNRRNFIGILKGYHDGLVTVDVDGTLFDVPHEAILRAHVAYPFDEEHER